VGVWYQHCVQTIGFCVVVCEVHLPRSVVRVGILATMKAFRALDFQLNNDVESRTSISTCSDLDRDHRRPHLCSKERGTFWSNIHRRPFLRNRGHRDTRRRRHRGNRHPGSRCDRLAFPCRRLAWECVTSL